MRPALICLALVVAFVQQLSAQNVIFEPVSGDFQVDNNGIWSCQASGSQLCSSCIEDFESPNSGIPPLIIAFGTTGLSGWSHGTLSGTVQPFVEVDGVTVLPALLPLTSYFTSKIGVGAGFVPNSPCGAQGLSYQIGSVSGSFDAGGNHEITIPANEATLIDFEISFCNVSAHWGAGCNINGSANDRWLLHLPDDIHAAELSAGDPAPLIYTDQDVAVDFGPSPGGIVTVLRSAGPPPLGPTLNGPDGYWEVNTDMPDDSFAAVVTVNYDPAEVANPSALVLACFDTTENGWSGLMSVVDLSANTVSATVSGSCVLVLTTDNPVVTQNSSWGALKAQYNQR